MNLKSLVTKINEEFGNYIEKDNPENIYYINPTNKELNSFKVDRLRFFADSSKKEFYVFDAKKYTHYDFVYKTKIDLFHLLRDGKGFSGTIIKDSKTGNWVMFGSDEIEQFIYNGNNRKDLANELKNKWYDKYAICSKYLSKYSLPLTRPLDSSGKKVDRIEEKFQKYNFEKWFTNPNRIKNEYSSTPLKEEFIDYYTDNYYTNPKESYPIFKNPNSKEIKDESLKGRIRFSYNVNTGDIYVFNENVFHYYAFFTIFGKETTDNSRVGMGYFNGNGYIKNNKIFFTDSDTMGRIDVSKKFAENFKKADLSKWFDNPGSLRNYGLNINEEHVYDINDVLPVYKNPTESDLKKINKKEVNYSLNLNNGKLYIYPSNVIPFLFFRNVLKIEVDDSNLYYLKNNWLNGKAAIINNTLKFIDSSNVPKENGWLEVTEYRKKLASSLRNLVISKKELLSKWFNNIDFILKYMKTEKNVFEEVIGISLDEEVIKLPTPQKNSNGELCYYAIKQHNTGNILSRHRTKIGAIKHLKQIEMFKHMKG